MATRCDRWAYSLHRGACLPFNCINLRISSNSVSCLCRRLRLMNQVSIQSDIAIAFETIISSLIWWLLIAFLISVDFIMPFVYVLIMVLVQLFMIFFCFSLISSGTLMFAKASWSFASVVIRIVPIGFLLKWLPYRDWYSFDLNGQILKNEFLIIIANFMFSGAEFRQSQIARPTCCAPLDSTAYPRRKLAANQFTISFSIDRQLNTD